MTGKELFEFAEKVATRLKENGYLHDDVNMNDVAYCIFYELDEGVMT